MFYNGLGVLELFFWPILHVTCLTADSMFSHANLTFGIIFAGLSFELACMSSSQGWRGEQAPLKGMGYHVWKIL